MTILFVCAGNTCRSPLAWARWRALQDAGEVPSDWSAFSAGLAPSEGQKASRHAVDIARGWGVDLSRHYARAVDVAALRHIDVCVAISPSHARDLKKMLRSVKPAPRVLCLSDFLKPWCEENSLAQLLGSFEPSASEVEIADPYGGSRESYESCARLIEQGVSRLARHLQEQNSDAHTSKDEPPATSAPE